MRFRIPNHNFSSTIFWIHIFYLLSVITYQRSMFFFKSSWLVYASLVAQTVKWLSAIWETWAQSLSQEDPLAKEMAIHASTLAWKIPWIEEPSRLHSMGSQSQTRLSNFTSFHFTCTLNPSPSSSFWNCTGCVPTYIANFLSSTGLSTTAYKHNLISPILKSIFSSSIDPTYHYSPLPPSSSQITLTVKLLEEHLCPLSKIPLLPSSFKLTPIRFMP